MEIEDLRVKTVTRKKKKKFLGFSYTEIYHIESIIQIKYKGGDWQLLNNERVIEFV